MKSLPDHIFRGYDIRGEVEVDLDEENVYMLGRAYAAWLIQRRVYDCVVGYDCRTSSPLFHQAIIGALISAGLHVYDIGMTLTQIAYFAQYVFRTRGMVMITASHNPREYNGFKLGSGFSETMLSDDICELKRIAQAKNFTKLENKGRHKVYDITQDYIADLQRFVTPRQVQPMRVVIDSCAATTGIFLPQILQAYGCTVIEQHTTPDGSFPVGTPDPTEKAVQERLAARVLKEKADIGFSYDADGDRMGVVDEKGTLVWNDTLCALYAIDVLDNIPGSKIVFNTLCSKQVSDTINAHGGRPIMWMTGHSFIKAKVREEKALFGGELSGHFYFVDNFYGHDDGALATLRLLSYLTYSHQTLNQAVSSLPQYISSPEIKLGYPDKLKFEFITNRIGPQLRADYPDAAFTDIDGIRMDTDHEMAILRASQNGPYITIKFEARSKDSYDTLMYYLSRMLHGYKEVDFSHGVNIDSLV